MASERPKSEMLALFDWRHVISNPSEQWRPIRKGGSDLSLKHKGMTSYICGSFEFIRESDAAMPSDEEDEGRKAKKKLHRSEITLNLKQRNPSQSYPKTQSMNRGVTARRTVSAIDIRHPERCSSMEKKAEIKRERDFNHRRHSMDVSLAKLRQEMNSLRRQDVELLEQLLSLDNSIREFKLSQASLSSSISDLSDDDLQEDLDTKSRRWRSRGSLGSDGSDLTSSSGRSSPRSNPSLSGSDVSGNESGHRQVPVKSAHRRSRGEDFRRFSHGKLAQCGVLPSPNGGKNWPHTSDVTENGSGYVRPTLPVRRNSDFRLAETKPLATLSKRQSTIW